MLLDKDEGAAAGGSNENVQMWNDFLKPLF